MAALLSNYLVVPSGGRTNFVLRFAQTAQFVIAAVGGLNVGKMW